MNDDTNEVDDRLSRRQLLDGTDGLGVFGAFSGAPAAVLPDVEAPHGDSETGSNADGTPAYGRHETHTEGCPDKDDPASSKGNP